MPWSKKLVVNTRIESALGASSLWRQPIREGRCIVPAATFFEPHATETVANPRTGKSGKRPYEFAMRDASPLLLAAVGEQGRFSIVTTEPNADVAPIHARMPLALRFEEVPAWLEGRFDGLANRSDVRFSVAPEHLDRPAPRRVTDGSQLSLF